MITTQGLCKTYGQGDSQVHALRPADIRIEPGSFVTIAGSSGSGKSTLLHLMGGLDRPTGGTVYYGDTDLYRLDEKALSAFRRREIGFVFQSYNLLAELTAYDNLVMPCLLDGKRPDRDYLDPIIDMLGLRARLQHLPGELSGGEQQRVAIARALANAPRVLLCDEPTGNLDSRTGQEVLSLLRETQKRFGQTIVMVTHNMEIARLSDRVISIQDGRIET